MRIDLPPHIENLQLDEYKERYETLSGNAKANTLFVAILFCGRQGIPMPEWVIKGFAEPIHKWTNYGALSLDEAFDCKSLTPGRLAQKRRNRLLNWQVYNAVNDAKKRGCSINGQLFERIAKDLGSSSTVVKELYYGKKRK